MEIILMILLSLSLRFYIADFIHTEDIRDIVKSRHGLITKWFDCPYCNGFWIGGLVYLVFEGLNLGVIVFAFIVAYLSYVMHVITTRVD